jgi:hypothetical protein
MSGMLAVCLAVLVAAAVGTLALMVIPITRGELRLWHSLGVRRVRRWITSTRRVRQPLHNDRTRRIARANLRWHFVLTCLFCFMVARALRLGHEWLQITAGLLTIPALAYLLGSVVQRQTLAIVTSWAGRAR